MFKALIRRLPVSLSTMVRYVILAATLMGFLAVGRLTPRLRKPELIPLVIIAMPVVFLALNSLEFGVLAIVLAAATVRFSIPTGTHSEIVASLALTALFVTIWLSRMLVVEKRIRLQPSPINLPLLGFVVTCVISFVWSNVFRDILVVTWDSWPFVQIGGLAVMILLPGALLLTANCITNSKWLKWLTGVFIVVGAASFLGSRARLPVHFLQVRPLFPTWLMSLSYAQALFNRRLSWPMRILLLLLAAGWFYEVFVNQMHWLSGWMPAVVSLAVISALKSKYFLVLLMIAIVAFGVMKADIVMARFEEEQSVSGETRLDAWLHNWRVTGQHWLFGVGPAGYAAYYMSYFPLEAMATHSTYIDILSQTGIVGLAFFLWLFAALIVSGWKLVKRLKGAANFEEAFSVAVLGGCMAAIVAMALGDWIVPFVYTQTIAGFDYAVYTWIMLGGMMSLLRIVQVREVGVKLEEQIHAVTP